MTIQCEQLTETGVCKIASYLAGQNVSPRKDACNTCLSCSVPKAVNYVTASIASFHFKDNKKKHLEVLKDFGEAGYFEIGAKPRKIQDGVGKELHDLLESKGYKIETGCKCLPMISKMNKLGPQWSYDNRAEIANVMTAEAQGRGIKILGVRPPEMLLSIAAERYILQAIRSYCQRTGQKINK